MSISKKSLINKNYPGFTIVELVVVLAGLAALSAISIPGVLNQIRLSKIESTKALMNGYAADCLGKYRTSINPSKDYVNKVQPSFDTDQLENLGYTIDGNNKTCTSFGIKPLKDDESFAYGMKFEVIGGSIVKTGAPTGSSESAYKSCKNWAGQNCGMTDAQKAKLAAARAEQERFDKCESNYLDWKQKARLANSDEKGTGRSWNPKTKKCSVVWWAYKSKIGPDKPWYEEEVEKAIGKKCSGLLNKRIDEKKLSDPEGENLKDNDCKGKYWFTLDNFFTQKTAWEKQVRDDAKNLCNADIDSYKEKDHTGEIVVKPKFGPLPCGTKIWFCKGDIEQDKDSWDAGECGQAEKERKEEAERKAAAEAAAKEAAEKKRLEDKNIPKEVKGRFPGETRQCRPPMPKQCNSPKWRRLIPDCKCWYPNG